jgi:serine/threonine protein kinase/Tfp pilus assembly protein PilF
MVPNPRWQQLDVLFSQAVDLDPGDRAAFLDEHCSGDPELRAEVESLIHSSEAAPDFLNEPILDSVRQVATETAPDLIAGTRIARYQVVRLIGEGGMGQVYLAQDGRLKRNVALKVLPPQLTRYSHALHRFEQEARAASALNHPNILTIFEFGEAGGMHFMASEFVEGETLRKRLASGEIPVLTALDIASQVASALAAAHANGIAHRDIKPENIVIRPDGFVKLLDFGIAKLTEKDSIGPSSASLTGAGMVLGTLKYMSPEQARGVKVDGRSDIFSLGAVLYEMITGREPFAGETSSDVIAEILKSDPPPLTGPAASACPELQAIVCKAMCKDREGRYQTAAQLSQDLQQLKRDIEFQSHAKQRSGETPASAADQIPRIAPDDGRSPAGSSLISRALHSWRAGIALAALVIALAVGFVLLRTPRVSSTSRQPRSLAILPFQNLKPDPATDFLGFSLADALTTKLAYVNSLNIRPSSAVGKYRNQVIDPRKVGGELQVDTLLTGSYIKDGDQLRISTQLVDIKADKIIWRDTVDLTYDKLLTVQDRVSQEIVSGLELNLSPAEAEHLKPDATIDARAYEYYLRGVDFYSLNDFAAAITVLEKSLAIEPNYAPAWAAYGRANSTQASLHGAGRDLYQKAQDAYERAIALNPSLVLPRIYMGNLFTDTGRVEQAIPLLRGALQTSPNDAEAHWELGYAYRFGGMLQQSVAEAERARGFDPQVKINSSAMNCYLYLGQYDKFLQSLPANNSAYVLFYRGFGAYHLKQWHVAMDEFNRAYEMDPSLLPAQVGKALSFAIERQNAQGLALLHKTEGLIEKNGVTDSELVYKVAQAYAVLGDKASAVHMFQHAVHGGFFCYPYFERDPLLDNIRHEPGFDQQMQDARRRHEEFKARFF